MGKTDKKRKGEHPSVKGPAGGILKPLSLVYGAGVRLRLSMYRTGLFRTHTLACPVISIGNITAGGSGKTPMTIHIAELLRKKGLGVAILSRGYKRSSKGVAVVSDGTEVLLGPSEAGDEPYLMARRLKGVPVIVGEDRVKAGEFAIGKFAPQCILLDDGFQHIRLFRDLNILLIDSKAAFATDRLLPAGLLREPLGAVGRADLVMVKGSKLAPKDSKLLKGFKLDTLGFHYKATGASGLKSGLKKKKRLATDKLKGLKAFAVAGVANPSSFLETLDALGVSLTGKRIYRDHHSYSKADFESLMKEAAGSELILTTEKDAIKLERFAEGKIPVYAVEIDVAMDSVGADSLDKHLSRILGGGL